MTRLFVFVAVVVFSTPNLLGQNRKVPVSNQAIQIVTRIEQANTDIATLTKNRDGSAEEVVKEALQERIDKEQKQIADLTAQLKQAMGAAPAAEQPQPAPKSAATKSVAPSDDPPDAPEVSKDKAPQSTLAALDPASDAQTSSGTGQSEPAASTQPSAPATSTPPTDKGAGGAVDCKDPANKDKPECKVDCSVAANKDKAECKVDCTQTANQNTPECKSTNERGLQAIFVGGVEQSGYSSLASNTNAFLQAYFKSPSFGPNGTLDVWGKVRLLSAPQETSQGIVTTFTDPTGQIQKTDFSKVGQAIDFVVGPEWVFAKPTKIAGNTTMKESLVLGFGATTPLNSQDVVLKYDVPAVGTVECNTLISRFSPQAGYSPGLQAAPASAKACLAGGYKFLALSNQDRSNFLEKYGAGLRLATTTKCSTTPCTDSRGVVDFVVGQDASVTGGRLKNWVFKIDGVYPLPIGSADYLYLFGSTSLRFEHNVDQSPLILSTPQSGAFPTLPSSSVIVLPLKQANRDFYRFGIGVNINQIWCKLNSNSSSCNNTSGSGTTTDTAKPEDKKPAS